MSADTDIDSVTPADPATAPAVATPDGAALPPAESSAEAAATPAAELPPLPDRLCTHPASPFHQRAFFERDIGVRFNGKERSDVEEYCVSEGWIKVPVGKKVDRRGYPLLIKLKGTVEVFYR